MKRILSGQVLCIGMATTMLTGRGKEANKKQEFDILINKHHLTYRLYGDKLYSDIFTKPILFFITRKRPNLKSHI